MIRPPRWPRISRVALVIFRRNFLAWSRYYKSSVLLNFGEPVTSLLAFGFGLGAYIAKMNGVPFAVFIGPGLLAVTAMNAVTFDMTFDAYDRLNVSGVYAAMLTTPVTASDIVAGEFLWEAFRSLLYGMVFLLVLCLMGLVRSWWALMIPVPLVFAGVMFAAPALWVSTRSRTHEQLFYYFTLVITPMSLFSGVFFPLQHLPPVLRTVILLTPLVHVVRIIRALVLGSFPPHIAGDVVWVLAYTALLTAWPTRSLARRLTG
ncbi:MAG: ABC transporter permease [Thermaerobacter sp.]|nr:ABC transporter permease [Thermaerobacter sp.]